ncbi:MAG: ribonuclease E inhibitor RraB [Cellvibrio sp.]
MTVIEQLMQNAEADTELLFALNEHGDNFQLPRLVEFTFTSESSERINAAADFIKGYQYAATEILEDEEEGYQLFATIEMPITQPLLLSVSGFFTCVAELFELDYNGWGSMAQTLNINQPD